MLKRAGRYEIVAELGRGGFGQVYRAFDPTLHSMVAIKTLAIDNDASVLARFRNEAAASRRLNHPNIVTIYDFGEQDGTPYIVMQLLEGQDLQRAIDSGKPLPLWHKIQIMTQIASGLGHAHAHDIVHRDVKPANVMLLPDGNVKIMDFGIALVSRDTQNRLTPRGAVIGTFRYMAPEQFRGLEQDVRGDIFAYGLMFYELLSGVHPFHAAEPAALMYNILNLEPVPIHEVCPGCPEQLQPVISRLLQKDPEFRYQNLEDVLFDCEPILSELKRAHARDLFEEARTALGDRRIEAGQALLRQVLELDPSYPGARDLRERLQTGLRRLTVRPRIEALVNEAREHLSAGNPAEAVQKFEAAARLDPADTTVKSSLEQAKAVLEKSRQVARLMADSERALGGGDLTGAHRIAQQAADLAPSDSRARALVSKVQAALAEQERHLRLTEDLARLRRLIDIRSWDQASSLLSQLEREFPQFDELRAVRQTLDGGRRADERQQKLTSGLAAARQEIQARSLEAARDRLVALRAEFPDAGDVDQLLRFAASEIETLKRSEFVDRSLTAARALTDRNRFADAGRLLQSALASYPADPVLERELRSVASARQQFERNAALVQAMDEAKALQAEQRFEQAQAPLDAFCAKYEPDPAVEELRQTIERQREAAERTAELRAMVHRVNDLLSRGNAEEATQLLRKPPQAIQDHPEITQLRTLAQVQLDRQIERATALKDALADASALRQQNNFDQAVQTLAAFTSRYGADPKVAELETSIQRDRQESQRRAVELDRVVRRAQSLLADGKAPEATQLLGSLPGDLKDHPEVIRLRDEAAIQVRKQSEREVALDAAISAASPLEQQGRFEDALKVLGVFVLHYGPDRRIAEREQAIRNGREAALRSAEIHELAARARDLLKQDDPQGALTVLQQALPLVSESRDLRELVKAAEARLAAQKTREAIDAVLAEARSLLSRGEFGAALKAIDSGLKRFPSAAELESIRAEIAAAEGAQRLEEFRARTIAQINSFTEQHQYDRASSVLEDAQSKLSGDEQLRQLKTKMESQRQRWAASQAEEKIQEELRRAQEVLATQPAESVTLLQRLCAQYPDRMELAAQLAQAHEALYRAGERQLIQESERLCGQNRFQEAASKLSQADRETPALHAARQQVEILRVAAESESIGQAIQSARETARRNPSQALAPLEKLHREFPARPEIAQAMEEIRAVIRDAEIQSAILEIQGLCASGKFSKARALHQKTVARLGSDAALAELLARIEESTAPKETPVAEPEPSQPKRTWVWAVSGVAAAALVGLGVLMVARRTPAPAPVQIHLAVRTDPAGAAVQIGGRSCVTPSCQFDLGPGNYTVTARMDGYQPAQREITLDATMNSRSESLTLQPVPSAPPAGVETGTLVIQAGLPDVLVFVDQVASGRTDSRGTLSIPAEAKTHSVRVQKPGYDAPAERQVRIAKNASQTAAFSLTQQMARLELRGAPAGVEVRADNTVLGRTDGSIFSGRVPPGDRVLRFSAGARESSQRFEPGGTLTLDWSNLAVVTPPPTPTASPVQPAADPAEQAWAPISTSSDPKAIEDYLKNYPNSRHKADAESRLDDAAWSRVNQNDAPSLRDYLDRFRNGRHAREGSTRISELAWNRVDQANEQQVREFIGQFPDSAHRTQADAIVDQLGKKKLDSEAKLKQDRAKQEDLKQRPVQAGAIHVAIDQFNTAFKSKDAKSLKQSWPNATRLYLDAIASAKQTGLILSLENCGDPMISEDTATVSCDQIQTSQGRSSRARFTVTLQLSGGQWSIKTLSAAGR